MGNTKTENTHDGKGFLGGLTEEDFYKRLHWLRNHFNGTSRFHK